MKSSTNILHIYLFGESGQRVLTILASGLQAESVVTLQPCGKSPDRRQRVSRCKYASTNQLSTVGGIVQT